jgi:hypothetical protein
MEARRHHGDGKESKGGNIFKNISFLFGPSLDFFSRLHFASMMLSCFLAIGYGFWAFCSIIK